MKAKPQKIEGGFTAIPNWYWECGLSLLEVNIIARIASWQRDNKEFYESAQTLSKLFGVSYSTMKRTFNSLVTSGFVRRNGKHKRMWKYVVNEYKLNTVHHEQLSSGNSSPRTIIQSTMNHYNTTKTSNKTSFREEDDFLESSPSQDKTGPTNLDIKNFAKEIG